MKIVHIITRLSKGGAEENTLMSCQHQASLGHEVHLIFGPDNLEREKYQDFEKSIHFHMCSCLRHAILPLQEITGLLSLRKLIKHISPDIVHTHTSKAGILGRLAAKLAGTPFIVHGVHILPFANVSWKSRFLYIALEKIAAPMTDLFIHVSQGTKEAYARENIGPKKTHAIVHSDMAIEKFKTATAPENWQKILKWEGPRPQILLMMAALEERKQQKPFLRGFAEALKGETICLLLAGEGPDRADIEALIKELGIEDRVRLLGHYSKPEELVALADLCVLASLREGLPRVIVQSFAGNRPAITGPIDGIEEIMKDGENGLIVREGDARDVACACVTLLKDTEKLAHLRSGAEKTNIDSWSFDSMFAALDEAVEKMVAGKAGKI